MKQMKLTEVLSEGADSGEKPIPAPTPLPSEPPSSVSDEELQAAVADILTSIEAPTPPAKHRALRELPRWIDEDDLPDAYECDDPHLSGPEYCNQCGARHPSSRPLERGWVIEREGEDGNKWYDHCPPGKFNIETCSCCGCPECGVQSIYKRDKKTPPWRCRDMRCQAEFYYPVARTDKDEEEIRTRLYWACRVCDTPILAPFEGVPDAYFAGDESPSASETPRFCNPVERRG